MSAASSSQSASRKTSHQSLTVHPVSPSASVSSSSPLQASQATIHNNDQPAPNSSATWRDTMSGYSRALSNTLAGNFMQFGKWLNSPAGHGVLKCTLAYTIASLATFASPISDFLGRPGGKHVVATITVYFHASRSVGSMIEAVLIATVAIAYAEIIGVLSMGTSVLVGSTLGLVNLAHALVVIIFIGGGFGFMGWVKQKMSNPLVNVGSTLASLAIISIVTKENAVVSNVFSNQKIVQMLKILLLGVLSATLVSLLLWRVSARALFRQSTCKASKSLGEMLTLITHGFLKGVEDESSSTKLLAAARTYSLTFQQVKKNLRETKFERYFLGQQDIYAQERACTNAIVALARSIGGLRSAANSQFALLSELHTTPDGPYASHEATSRPISLRRGSSTASAKQTDPQHHKSGGKSPLRTVSDTFELFVDIVRPQMEDLTAALSQVLEEPPFGLAPKYEIASDETVRQRLTDALRMFTMARAEALGEIYQLLEIRQPQQDKMRAGLEEVAAACGHFTFSLQSLGEEMQKYLDVVDDLKYATDHGQRSWRWLLWWRKDKSKTTTTMPFDTPEAENLLKPPKETISPEVISDQATTQVEADDEPASSKSGRMMTKLSKSMLKFLRILARDDIRFGLKVGIGAALWAMLAFIPETRDWYNHYRGEWGLTSFMIVCSMTVGASNTTGWARFLGTLIGAAFSAFNWTVSQGNAVALVILGACVSFYNFWLIVARGKAPLGRMTLLTYNVSTLYAYSLSQTVEPGDEDEGGSHPLILEIVGHRAISVIAGILWGLIICRGIWPISARKKFKEGTAALYLQMGLIWRRGPLAILLRSDSTQSYLRSGEQAAMQKQADRLETMRVAAASEFELRGPFPSEIYGRVMQSTNRTLDGFHAMSLVTHLKGSLTPGERALLTYTAPERALLCDRICHVCHVLASSLMLEYPLTNSVPGVMGTRDRLISKIFEFRNARMASSPTGSSSKMDDSRLNVTVEEKDYALLYAYALVTRQVAEELKVVEKEIAGLFGVLNERTPLLY